VICFQGGASRLSCMKFVAPLVGLDATVRLDWLFFSGMTFEGGTPPYCRGVIPYCSIVYEERLLVKMSLQRGYVQICPSKGVTGEIR
jgi:hypothetical protein